MYRKFNITTLLKLVVIAFCFFTTPNQANAVGYKQGTFTIKPIIVAFANSSFGFKKDDSKINGLVVDAYRNRTSFGFAHPSRNGVGYSFELGYLFMDDLEAFITPFFSYEKGQDVISLGFQSFRFSTRRNYGFMLGARKYFDIDSEKWFPHVSFSLGLERQGKTNARSFQNTGFQLPPNLIGNIGSFTLKGSENNFLGELLFGADYKFTPNVMLTFMAGLNYKEKGSERTTVVKGIQTFQFPGIPGPVIDVPVSYKDNHNVWSVPIAVALKFAI